MEVYWHLNDLYSAGVVSSTNEGGKCMIQYGKTEQETLNMSAEKWPFEKSSINASALNKVNTLDSDEQDMVLAMTIRSKGISFEPCSGF